jgi:FMN phosphatase YigB (HAD superfamily)
LPGLERCFKNTGAKELNEIIYILKEKIKRAKHLCCISNGGPLHQR